MSEPMRVFVNCPFDAQYSDFKWLILFAIRYFGGEPLISQTGDTSESRLERIVDLLRSSTVSIHDISLIRNNEEYPRFNMPFELGVDLGLRAGLQTTETRPVCILVGEPYEYQKYISDLAGRDLKPHYYALESLAERLFEFFHSIGKAPGPHQRISDTSYTPLWDRYGEFKIEQERYFRENNFNDRARLSLLPSQYLDMLRWFFEK